MSLFQRRRRPFVAGPSHPLVGRWRTDPGDGLALAAFGEVQLDFRGDGSLTWTGASGPVAMTWRADEVELTLGLAGGERDTPTPYTLEPGGDALVLRHGHQPARFLRERSHG